MTRSFAVPVIRGERFTVRRSVSRLYFEVSRTSFQNVYGSLSGNSYVL